MLAPQNVWNALEDGTLLFPYETRLGCIVDRATDVWGGIWVGAFGPPSFPVPFLIISANVYRAYPILRQKFKERCPICLEEHNRRNRHAPVGCGQCNWHPHTDIAGMASHLHMAHRVPRIRVATWLMETLT